MLKIKNKGKPTYRRDMVTWIWEPEKIEKDLFQVANKFGKSVENILLRDVDVRSYKKWTLLGPQSDMIIKIFRDYSIRVGCYRDGWHIELVTLSREDYDLKKEVFGDVNKNKIWTNETEKVPDLMREMYISVKDYLEKK